MIEVTAYVLYLLISIVITIWVARTLSTHGRTFLVRSFENEALADSVNHMLVVGFYLVNIGFVSLALRLGTPPTDVPEVVKYLSTKIGVVMLMLGSMHFFNLYVISHWREWSGKPGADTAKA